MSELMGTSQIDSNKKLHRITVLVSDDEMTFISTIADELSISNSEVISRLIQAPIKNVKIQKEIIEKNTLTVAFDIITKR